MTPEEREQLEATYTFRRVVELELDPVRGNFDAAHLKEVTRRLFQDLPGVGLDEVTPGAFRPPVPIGKDWMKNRALSTVDGAFHVAYSRMDEAAKGRLKHVLQKIQPAELQVLTTAEFTARLANAYVEIDYIHPFSDGNSRTLRTFTKQLAKAAGYDLDWERFGRSPIGRDLLYIARDISVNKLALPHCQSESSMRKISHTLDRLQGNRDLPDLLRDAIRPSRAVAFERLPKADALEEYPELSAAYNTLERAQISIDSNFPGNLEAQRKAMQPLVEHIQYLLDKGEIAGFGNDFSSGTLSTVSQPYSRARRPQN